MNPSTTLTLSLHVTDTRSGAALQRQFRRFPVRLGRNALNDLPLDFGFVSQFHVVLEKSEQSVMLRDLGSRNGATVNGQRIVAHERHDLAASGYVFEIGPLRFQASLSMMAKQGGDDRTAMLVAVSENPAAQDATQAWQAFVETPAASGRDPRDVALQGLQHLATTFASSAPTPEDPESVLQFLRRVKFALDLLFETFIPTRDAVEQTRALVDLTPPAFRDATAATTAANAGELALNALDWQDPNNETLRAVQSIFADAVIEHLAVPEGAKRIFDALAPKSIEGEYARGGASMRFGPFKEAALWRLYEARHRQLEPQAVAMLFGTARPVTKP